MPSEAHEAVVRLLQAQPRPADATIEERRAAFEQLGLIFKPDDDVKCEKLVAGGVPAEWVRVPESDEPRVLLYLHGGGYVVGSSGTHRQLISRLARATRMRALSLDYRRAPEHPFPAAVEDATAAYRWLLGEGVEPTRIAIAGDSAGGGLTPAPLLAPPDAGAPPPAAGACLSPSAHLQGTGPSAPPAAPDHPLIPPSPPPSPGSPPSPPTTRGRPAQRPPPPPPAAPRTAPALAQARAPPCAPASATRRVAWSAPPVAASVRSAGGPPAAPCPRGS